MPRETEIKPTKLRYAIILVNILSFSRIIAAPFFFYLIRLAASSQKSVHLLSAFGLFFYAALSDTYDGYCARQYNAVTRFGLFIDPLSDKIFVLSAFGAFLSLNMLSPLFFIIVAGRDLLVTILRLFLVQKKQDLKTSMLGKYKTGLQFFLIFLLMVKLVPIAQIAGKSAELFKSFIAINITWTSFFIAAITIYSLIDYIANAQKISRS